ncbi:hypothetical protein Taro_046536, partial [Colocasia esculenta]|nr:hypothetical protein [Colocasia esculenta]
MRTSGSLAGVQEVELLQL